MPARRRTAVRLGVPAAGLLVAIAVGAHAATTTGTGQRYRLATVRVGSVDQTLVLTGTAQPTTRYTATFPTAGTVTSVAVTLGQQVRAGDVLATVDPAPLRQAVLDAQAQVAQAQVAVDSAEAGTAVGASAVSAPVGGSGGTGSGAAGGAPSATRAAPSSGTPDALIAAVQVALRQQRTACESVLTPASGSGGTGRPDVAPPGPTGPRSGTPTSSPTAVPAEADPTPAPSGADQTPAPGDAGQLPAPGEAAPTTGLPTGATTPGATPSRPGGQGPTQPPSQPPTPGPSAPGPTRSPSPSLSQLQSCVGALTALVDAEVKAGAALTAYARQLDARAAAGSAAGGAGTTRGGAGPSGGAATGGAGSLAADVRSLQAQSSLLSAQQGLATAERNLAAATLTAPIPGQVGAIALRAGGKASTTAGITIVGPGVTEVTVNVPVGSLASIKAGQRATVTPPGQPGVEGRVTTVGLLPSSGANAATVSYPVTVLLPSTLPALASGAKAQVSIVTSTVAQGLVVPLSALTRTGPASGTVQLLAGADPEIRQVGVGAVGTGTAQLTAGVTAGDQVVLADTAEPLPANNSQANRRLGAGAGAGAGGSFGGGQFGGSQLGGAGSGQPGSGQPGGSQPAPAPQQGARRT